LTSFPFKKKGRDPDRQKLAAHCRDRRQRRLLPLAALVLACGLLTGAGAPEVASGQEPDNRVPPASTTAGQPLPAASPLPEELSPGARTQAVSAGTATAPAPSAPAGTEAVPAPSGEEDADMVQSMYDSISRGFLGSAMWLDSFFGDERYEAEVYSSQLKLRFEAFREGDTGMDYRRPNFDLRLVLPQLRRKTRLVVSGDPTVDYDASATPGATPSGQPVPPGGTGTVTTSLQYFPVETKRSNVSLRAGLKLSGGKLQLLLGPRYRYLVEFGPWDLRFTQEIIWTTDVGWQSLTRFDYERTLHAGLFFRTTLEGVWTESVNGYPYALRFLLRHPLDTNRALEYEWINTFQTRPTNLLMEEMLIFRYRQRFWKKWLFLEIDPQFRYPRDQGFAFTPGILFRLEMIFGRYGTIF
jgi:hypothetical protein